MQIIGIDKLLQSSKCNTRDRPSSFVDVVVVVVAICLPSKYVLNAAYFHC